MVSRRSDEFAEVGELLFDGADLDFVEIAGGFLAIARDEGDGAAFVEQLDDGDERLEGEVEGLCDVQEDFRGEGLCVGHVCSVYRSGKGSGKRVRRASIPGKIMTNWQPLGSIFAEGFGLIVEARDRTSNDERNNVPHQMIDIAIA